MKFSPDGAMMLARGEAPVLMEPMRARITVRHSGAPQLIALDHDGCLTDRRIPVENGTFTKASLTMKSIRTARRPFRRCFWLPLAIAVLGSPLSADDIEPLGKPIYPAQCAVCHGADKERERISTSAALVGDLSVAQLAEVIVGDDAGRGPRAR